MNQHKPYKSWVASQTDHAVNLVGIQKCWVFWAASKQSNDQLRCLLLPTTCEIKEKRPELANRKGIVFHRDNARPHTSLATHTKLLELGLGVTSHPPYSPDLTPSYYHLFRCLQNFLNGQNFSNNDDLKSHLVKFFAVKDQKFYQRGIVKLPEKRQKVIEQNGRYLTD